MDTFLFYNSVIPVEKYSLRMVVYELFKNLSHVFIRISAYSKNIWAVFF